MKMTYIILFIMLIAYSTIFSQNNITFGIRDEIGMTYTRIGGESYSNLFVIPINLYLTIDFNINGQNSFQLRPGYILAKYNFWGWELGGNWIHNFLSNKLFSSFGFYFHFNNDVAGGNRGGTGNTLTFISFGLGYRISDIIRADLAFHHPLQKNYGFFFYKTTHHNHFIANIIKLGVAIRFTN